MANRKTGRGGFMGGGMGSMSMVNGGRKEGVGRQGAWHAVGTLK